MKEEFNLTRKGHCTAFSQSLPTSVNLKEDILVELALPLWDNNITPVFQIVRFLHKRNPTGNYAL